jgi:hypothetical protein
VCFVRNPSHRNLFEHDLFSHDDLTIEKTSDQMNNIIFVSPSISLSEILSHSLSHDLNRYRMGDIFVLMSKDEVIS